MIYLDYAATTPVHPAVVDAMRPYWTTHFGNPSSVHSIGQTARRALDQARRTIADLLGASPNEIIFTSGATESCNWAMQGVLRPGDHLLTSQVEHKAVLNTAAQWQTAGNEMTAVPADSDGLIAVDDVAAAIQPNTRLLSIQAANNEVGTIQPYEAIGTLAQERGILFHTDAVQLIQFRRWQLAQQPFDMMSIAPHKFGAPKGIGILYVREGVPLRPLLAGGSQERGLRPGTSNVGFAVAAAKAMTLAMTAQERYVAHCTALRDRLIAGVLEAVPAAHIQLTGHPTQRLPHIASFALKQLTGNDLLMHLDMAGIAASSGSACTVGNPEPSHVLTAMGLAADWVAGSVRFSVGGGSTGADVDAAVAKLATIVTTLRALNASPTD